MRYLHIERLRTVSTLHRRLRVCGSSKRMVEPRQDRVPGVRTRWTAAVHTQRR
jgi:hypothetical protein